MLRNDFSYGGYSLSDWQMKMYDADQAAQWVGRAIDKGNMNAFRDTPSHYNTHYESVLQHFFLIIRDPSLFQTTEALRLTDKDIHQLRSWLEYPRTPQELELTEDDEQIKVCYMGLFTDIQPFIVAERCYGLKLTFTCDSPYGFSPQLSKKYLVPAGSTNMLVDFINTPVLFTQMLDPIIRVTPTADTFVGGVLQIGQADEAGMQITLPAGGSSLQIDCRRKIITSVLDGQETILTLETIGAQTTDDYFGDISLTQSVQWLHLNPSGNQLRFDTTGISQDISIEIGTRYILKAGGV